MIAFCHTIKYEESSKKIKEYSKEDLINNTILFEVTREECSLGIHKTPGETCSNITKVLIDIYKKQAKIQKQ